MAKLIGGRFEGGDILGGVVEDGAAGEGIGDKVGLGEMNMDGFVPSSQSGAETLDSLSL